MSFGPAGLGRIRQFALPGLAGVMLALGQAPFSLFWLSFAGLALLLLLNDAAPTRRDAFQTGFWAGFVQALIALSWVAEPFLVYIAMHGWMAPFALTAMAAGFALFFAAALWAARGISLRLGQGALVWTALALTLAEIVRSHLFGGFPWALVSHTLIGTPYYLFASWVGPLGVSLLLLLCAAGFAGFVRRASWAGIAGSLVLLAALWQATYLIFPAAKADTAAKRPVIRIVQANIPQRDKWKTEKLAENFQRHLDLTDGAADSGVDLVVWPEVAVPFLIDSKVSISAYESMTTASGNLPIVFGVQRYTAEEKAYNAMAVLDREGKVADFYDKRHLVPFGEFLPGGPLLERIGLSALAAQFGSFFTPGQNEARLDTLGAGIVRPMICYEGIFAHELRDANGTDWMLMITNDAWFGKWTGPYQHFAQARARAIETGLPMVRGANTGVSGVIDARGNVVASIALREAGHVDVVLPQALPATVYLRLGDKVVYIAFIVISLVLLLAARRMRIDRGRRQG